MSWQKKIKSAQSAGFEPARAEPNGFLVHRLNHSATTALKNKRVNAGVNIALGCVSFGVRAAFCLGAVWFLLTDIVCWPVSSVG